MKNGSKLLAAALLLCGVNAANVASAADKNSMLTMDDTMLGVSLSQYDYRQPNLTLPSVGTSDVKQSGPSYGIHGEKTWALADGDFLRLDGNFQGGKMDYHGSGSSPSETLRFYDVRLVYGVDEQFSSGVLSTYAGLGYRYLYNDGRGVSYVGKTAYRGYQREQQYTYLPIGMRYKTMLGNKKLTLNGEAGLLISGSNTTHLSDVVPSAPNLVLKQRSGYELRLAAMVNQGAWEVGPYLQYWRVNDSEKQVVGPLQYWEPRNTTVDAGFKVDRHF